MDYMPVKVIIERLRSLSDGDCLWVQPKTSLHSLRVGLLRQAKNVEFAIVTQKVRKDNIEGLKVYRMAKN